MRAKGEVPSRITLHPHPHAHSLLNLHVFLHHHPPSDGSETPPSLTQPGLISPLVHRRTPRLPNADDYRALTYPLSAFPDGRPVPFATRLFTELKRRQASDSDGFGWK